MKEVEIHPDDVYAFFIAQEKLDEWIKRTHHDDVAKRLYHTARLRMLAQRAASFNLRGGVT